MRALRVPAIGADPALVDVPVPVPGPGQVLVSMLAAGINPVDVVTSRGGHYSGVPATPYTVGTEGVGRVVGGSAFPLGTRVYCGRSPSGSVAEFFLAGEGETWALPGTGDDSVAVALGITGLAGWLPLTFRARLRAGERVLVLGATGRVGGVAVQAARLAGASHVVAAGRDRAALDGLLRLGAHRIVDLSAQDPRRDLLEAFDGTGPDVVLDPLWGDAAVTALEVAAPFARVVQMGRSAAGTAVVPSDPIRGKCLSLLGYSNRRVPLEARRAAHLEMLGHAAAGRLAADVTAVPLDRAATVWTRTAQGSRTRHVVGAA
jgi:NADPH2:quinone reductase